MKQKNKLKQHSEMRDKLKYHAMQMAFTVALTYIAGYSGIVYSDDMRWYKIELIVFRLESITTEQFDTPDNEFQWPSDLAELDATITELNDDLFNPIPFSQVGPKDRDLDELYKKLKRSKDYSPRLHFAWLQPIDANSLGNAVHIHAQAGKATNLNQQRRAHRQNPNIDGYVRLQRGIYLHFMVDFTLTGNARKPSGIASLLDPENNNKEIPIYRIKQRRRIRNNELHYFDHPKFGIISKVSPLEISEAIEELKIEDTSNIE